MADPQYVTLEPVKSQLLDGVEAEDDQAEAHQAVEVSVLGTGSHQQASQALHSSTAVSLLPPAGKRW